jgi:outer membrane lipoprotein carrier protein
LTTWTVWNRRRATIWLCLIMVILGCGTVWAAKKLTNQEVLNRAKERFANIASFRADLTEVFQWERAETTTETHGIMLYRKDDRFRLEFPNQQLVVDGETLWRYNPEHGQLLVESYNDESGVILPKQLLAGLSEHWVLKEASETVAQDSLGYRLDLTPRDPTSAFRRVKVWIDLDNWLVRRAVVHDAQGNRTEYRIDDVAVNPHLPDSLFQVRVPQGTETIDLR